MKLHELSTVPLDERQAHPYAVAYEGEVIRFDCKASADLYALFFDGAQRFVAVTEPEYLSTAVIPGWRQVTYFV